MFRAIKLAMKERGKNIIVTTVKTRIVVPCLAVSSPPSLAKRASHALACLVFSSRR